MSEETANFSNFFPVTEILSVVKQCAILKHALDGNEGRMETCLHTLSVTSAFISPSHSTAPGDSPQHAFSYYTVKDVV